jgi:hypothetical protein
MSETMWVVGEIGWGSLENMRLVIGGTEQEAVDEFVEEGDDYGMEFDMSRADGLFVYQLTEVAEYRVEEIPTPKYKLVRLPDTPKPRPRKTTK